MTASLTEISGIGPQTAAVLANNGFKTVDSVANASVESLSNVPGFSQARAASTIKSARDLLSGKPASAVRKRGVRKAPAAGRKKKAATSKKKSTAKKKAATKKKTPTKRKTTTKKKITTKKKTATSKGKSEDSKMKKGKIKKLKKQLKKKNLKKKDRKKIKKKIKKLKK